MYVCMYVHMYACMQIWKTVYILIIKLFQIEIRINERIEIRSIVTSKKEERNLEIEMGAGVYVYVCMYVI